ncbi:tetratricopeptide repeat protein [Bacillus sp. UMB0893]|uniref:tetratricopeptide repeat protein n=1 Tax=Bacillus sp. UMB0893 TaxID=2066053 RepID=UPI0021523C0F|nr:hypothetical protein [Bacillus sp. UMB0893]
MEKNDTHMKQFEEGKRVLMMAIDGDKNAVKIAFEIFLKLREAEPDNALIEAYYGSVLVLLGRDADQPLEKADKAQEGLDSLNQAISMDPNQTEIRLMRAKVCLRLPEAFFHCSQTAIEDFSFLLDRYKEDPSFLTTEQVRGIMEDLGAAYQNAGKLSEANEVLQQLTQLNRQLENVSEKDIEILLKQVIPLHKDPVEGNEKAAVQEKKNDTHMEQFEEGKRVLMKGADGDKNAVKIAYEIFLELRKTEPDNALIEAYYGSTLALLARDAVQPLEKADKAQEGLDSLNQAIAMDPNQKEIRLLRAKVCLRLPESFFHCSQTAIEDLSFLLDRYKENSSYLTNEQVRKIKEDLSTAYQNAGKFSEANEVLQRTPQLNRQVENGSEKDIEIFLEQVVPLHKNALGGNKKAVQDMKQLVERARSDYPEHPLVEAYNGITMMLIARDKTSPLGRLRGAKAGLKILDEAVSAAPQDSRIRLLRGRASYRLPEQHFQLAQTVIEDYTFLIDREMHEEGFLETENYLQLIYELGEVYCRIGRNQAAAMCWKRLMNETQNPHFLHLLKLKLKSLEGKPAVEHILIPESLTSNLLRRTVRAAGSEILSWAEQQKKEETPRKLNQKKKR